MTADSETMPEKSTLKENPPCPPFAKGGNGIFSLLKGGFTGFRGRLSFLLLAFSLPFTSARAQPVLLEPIASPRFAAGDVDGDGTDEIIAGGRVGPFRAVTDPASVKRARVDVYRQQGDLLQLLASGPELHVVEDVAAGDLDGDGRAEILAVGNGRLVLLDWHSKSLRIRRVEPLDSGWTDRVAAGDLDGDGRAEVAVTFYGVEADAERGRTEIVFYAWTGSGLAPLQALDVSMHVGDLALIAPGKGGGPQLILEVGTGDEGGEIRLYRTSGQPYPREVWRGPGTPGGARALNLATLPGSNAIAVGAIDGTVRLFELEGDGLRFRASGPPARPLTGLLLLNSPGGRARLLLGARGARMSAARLLPLPF